jgi:diguanylate cyclase (GGDEF)-like protein
MDWSITMREYEIPVRIRAVPVHNQHGSIVGAMELFDATEQPNADECQERLPGSVDEVTGVATRTAAQSHLHKSYRTHRESGVQFGVLLIRVEGLDHFRSAFGPEAANGLLRVVGRTIEGTLWRTDFLGRWADAQFLVVLNGCSQEDSVRDRLQLRLANDSIEWWGERRSLPVSIGHAIAREGEEVDSILERIQKSLESASAWRTCSSLDPSSGSQFSNVCHYRHCRSVRLHRRWVSDGAWESASAHAASRTGDHRGDCDWNGSGCQPDSHS